MAFIAHVALHLSLCNSVARLPANAPIEIRLHEQDYTGRQKHDEDFHIQRGEGAERTVEFDTPRGTFGVLVTVPKYKCAAFQYLTYIADHTRNVKMALSDGMPPRTQPLMILGTEPQSFSEMNPTYVLIGKDVKCDGPIGDLIQANATIEDDQDAYYVSMLPSPDIDSRGPFQVALQIDTTTGEGHLYIRLKIPFPQPWRGWPQTYEFDIPDALFDEAATRPIDTFWCPKMTRTSAG